MRKIGIAIILLLFFQSVGAQNTRIKNYNNIGWYAIQANYNLNTKFSLHAEFQWRRVKLISEAQQNLVRASAGYRLHPDVQLRLGYAFAETFAYGDIPINAYGKNFTEHRFFGALTISDQISKINITHRLMIEERWVGRYSSPLLEKEDSYVNMNRLRYQLRAQVPLKTFASQKQFYVAAYDELFIGFGKHVQENIFDQNRSAVLLGIQFNKTFRIEAGYLNQIVQLGREINQNNVFQYNNGILISTTLSM